MECRRCLNPVGLLFRVQTDEIKMMVCVSCADEARRLGLPVEAVTGEVDSPSLMFPNRPPRKRVKNRDRAGTLCTGYSVIGTRPERSWHEHK
jgi:hypothetical protein